MVTDWHLDGVTSWRCLFPIDWSLFRKIKRVPHLLWRGEVDEFLEEYLLKVDPTWEGLSKYRAYWDHFFGEIDGRNRRLSEASTINRGDWVKRNSRKQREIRWVAGRRRWIESQPDPEQIWDGQWSNFSPLLAAHEGGTHPNSTREAQPGRNRRRLQALTGPTFRPPTVPGQ